jgi:hypothetical protein
VGANCAEAGEVVGCELLGREAENSEDSAAFVRIGVKPAKSGIDWVRW